MKKRLLGITAALTLAGSAFAAAKPEQIPADATGVALFQMGAFLNSPAFKAIESKLPPGSLDPDGSDSFGPKDIKEVTLFFGETWAGAVVEFPGKAADVVKIAVEDAREEKIAGKTVWVKPFGPAIMQLNANELLLITEISDGSGASDQIDKAVAYLLDSKTPRLAAASPFAGALCAKPDRYFYGIVANVNKAKPIQRFHQALVDINKLLAADPNLKAPAAIIPGIENVQRIALSLTDCETNALRLSLSLTSDTNEHGTQIQESFLGLKAVFGIFLKDMPALAPIHKSFSVKQKATVTEAAITLRAEDLTALIDSIVP